VVARLQAVAVAVDQMAVMVGTVLCLLLLRAAVVSAVLLRHAPRSRLNQTENGYLKLQRMYNEKEMVLRNWIHVRGP